MPTEKTKAQLDDDILETVYTNDNAEVTAATTQALLRDINESAVNKTDDADKLVDKSGETFTNDNLTVDGNYEYEHGSNTLFPACVTIWGPDGRTRAVQWMPKDGTNLNILVVLFGGAIEAGDWTIKHIA